MSGLVEFLRRWWPCFRQEHEWGDKPRHRHMNDGVTGHHIVGRVCTRCGKFRGEWAYIGWMPDD